MLSHPIGQSLVIPLAISCLLSLLICFFVDRKHDTHWAGLAISVGLLTSYLITLGVPPLPPRISTHKLFFLIVSGIAVGVTLEQALIPYKRTAFILFGVVTLTWLTNFSNLKHNPEILLTLLGLLVLWSVTFHQFQKLNRCGLLGIKVTIICAIGIAATTGLGNSASLAQMALAIATSTLGFYFVMLRRVQMYHGDLFVYAAVVPLLVLFSQISLFGGESVLPTLPLLSLLFIDRILPLELRSQRVNQMATAIILLFPLAITVGIAFHL